MRMGTGTQWMTVPVLASALVLFACGGDDDGGGAVDAAPVFFDGAPVPDVEGWGTPIVGRVCSVIDLRNPYACQPGQDVEGISVTVRSSGSSATTRSDGSFGVEPAEGDEAVFLEIGADNPDRQKSVVRVPLQDGAASGVIAPSMTAIVWDQIVSILGAEQDGDTGTVVLKILERETPAAGLVVVPPDGTAGPIFYDAGGPFEWSEAGPTSHAAVALVHGVPITDEADFLVRDLSATRLYAIDGLSTEVDAITFERVDVLEAPPGQ